MNKLLILILLVLSFSIQAQTAQDQQGIKEIFNE
jgi:hypothetical protein